MAVGSTFVMMAVAGAVMVMSAIVITLVIAFIGRGGRAIASVFLALGLLVTLLLGAGLLMPRLAARTSHLDVDYMCPATPVPPAMELPVPAEPLRLVKLDDAPDSPKAAADTSSASDETTDAKKTESEQPSSDDDRPDWVGGKPFKAGGVYMVPVTVGPWPTSEETLKRLPEAVDKEIAKYAVIRAGHHAAAKTKLPVDFVMTHMIKDDRWEEPVQIDSFDDVKHMVGRDVWENTESAADGRWNQLHVLVKFDDEVNRRLDEGWARQSRIERLVSAGVLVAIVMIVLGTVYSYLKIDLQTGGAYRGRLRAGALAAILVLWVVLVLLSRG